ncbi:MAG: hypothetical protein IPG42_08905 [Betaproteobacteria bacterium]|nr:hypothetical protein [Betaproteobacteria bacterium]
MISSSALTRSRVILALGVCLAFALGVIGLSRSDWGSEVKSPDAIPVSSAQLAEAGGAYPHRPPDRDELTPVTLPDNWDARRPDYHGYVWYRIDWPVSAQKWARPTIYLPVAAMNAEVWVNGQRAGGSGRMDMPPSRHFYTPQLIEIAPGLIRRDGAENEVWVLLVGHPGYRCGLAPVWLGEHNDLLGPWRIRRFWQTEGNAATIVINLSMAVFVLLIGWRDRAHSAYVWFGAAIGIWALRNLNYWVTNPVIPDLLFAELCVSGAAWFVALFSIFAMRFSEMNEPHYRCPVWFVPCALGYASLASVYFLSASSYARANAGFAALAAMGISFTVWSMVRLWRLAFACPTPHFVAVAGGAVIYLLLLLNDYAIGVNHNSLGEIFLRQYAALPLFIAVTATLAKRYGEALRQSQELAASLQTEVQAQRAQLAASFEQLRDAEREQARAQERARVMGDLHDGLGLHLVAALRQARALQSGPGTLADSLQDCLDELRVAVDSLDEHERDPLSLLGTLRFRMAPRFDALGIRLDWQIGDDLNELPALDPAQALDLLRIVQELLGNALKHSGATVVTIGIRAITAGTEISVSDNGRGFGLTAIGRGRGLGNLQNRAQRLGATLNWIQLNPGTGALLLLSPSA